MTLPDRLRHTLRKAFTLIELITVIAIIAILMALLLPVVNQVRLQANKARAKSDVLNIVGAVKAYYTDYGQYPPGPALTGSDVIIGPSSTYKNYMLMDVLRNVTDTAWMVSGTANLRQIPYLDIPNCKSTTAPKGGIFSGAASITYNGNTVYPGDFMDPWGTAYYVAIDYSYDNVIDGVTIWSDVNTSTAATSQIRSGSISWSVGLDGVLGSKANPGVLNATSTYPASDDVVSFQ